MLGYKFLEFLNLSNCPGSQANKSLFLDCLYLDGRSYTGNLSVTVSGISCQSWTEQCPHRHTMNNTYPELNLAQNFCRNPQSSGKRPWCFTTDRNKRWEYCDVPKCILGNAALMFVSKTQTLHANCLVVYHFLTISLGTYTHACCIGFSHMVWLIPTRLARVLPEYLSSRNLSY